MRIRSLIQSLAVAGGLVACGSPESAEQAHTLVEGGATLLDVRTPGEYAAGHLDGALNIPVQQLGSRIDEVSHDAPVVVYCQSGGRSASAARFLSSSGYEVLDLGAMSNW